MSSKAACFFLQLALILSLSAAPLRAQPQKDSGSLPEDSRVTTLSAVAESIVSLTEELRSKEKELEAAGGEERKKAVQAELNSLSQQLNSFEENFESIATGVNWSELNAAKEQDFNWQKELRDIFQPALKGMKKITERPMQIEKLRGELDFHQKQLAATQRAAASVEQLLPLAERADLRRRLRTVRQKLTEQEKQLSSQLAVITHKLEERLNEKTSLWQSSQELLQMFFKSRGRNLLLSILAFAAVFSLLRLGYRFLRRLIPAYREPVRPFYLRLFEVSYQTLTYAGAGAALLLALYVLNDWILLSVMLVFSLGIAWAAKQGVAQFWEQTKLVLNIGAVRDGERIVYNGLPWRVASISLYSRLENPDLSTPFIRVRLKDLIGLASRPYHPQEPWFPCRTDDWVLLSDGSFGKVGILTPEFVQIFLGDLPKFYRMQDFLSMTPGNLSKGFFLVSTFGIDYAHQAICTGEAPELLKEALRQRLTEEGFGADITDIVVQFKEAGLSSLDFLLVACFSGKAAPFYGKLSRLLQQIAVETATAQQWSIPFPQVSCSFREGGPVLPGGIQSVLSSRPSASTGSA
ncbi:hypothetical protein [Candidatus Electronema sp. JC]|uniref:hypothetical protein n=1 Tax=Candidatus Electronema sp. JC TaxID=3401570 RepID=UPI003B431454